MFGVTGAGNVAGRYVSPAPSSGARRTAITADDLNRLFDELSSVVVASGLTLNQLDNTQVLQAVRTLISDRRNAIVNGDFAVREYPLNVTFTAPAYAQNRWWVDPGTGGSPACKFDRQVFPFGVPEVPGRPPYYANFLVTVVPTTTAPSLIQRLERVETLAGNQVVLSFFAKRNKPTGSYVETFLATPSLTQYFGGAAFPSPSTPVVLTGTPHTITSTWTRFATVFDLPSVDGSVLGSGEPYLECKLLFETNKLLELYIADAQLEIGAIPSRFERLQLYEQQVRCWQFREKSSFVLGGEEAGTDFVGGQAVQLVPRRYGTNAPTIKFSSPTTGASAGSLGTIRWNGADINVTAVLSTGPQSMGYPQVGAAQPASKALANWIFDNEIY